MKKVIDNTNLGYLVSKEKATFWPKSQTVQIGLDDIPTENSNNLVKSGGVFDAIEDVMEAVDGSNVETVTVLPAASASTVGKIYYVGPDGNGEYARYRGIESGGSYSFLPLGSTAMDLTDYATKEEVSQLYQEVDVLGVETTVEEVTERIEQGWNQGYVNQYGSIGLNFPEAMHSDPIFLKAGEVLTVNGVTRTWAARFASYNPDTGTYSVIQMGTSADNDAASVYSSSYTANADIYIVVSWSYNVVPVTVTKTYTKVTTTSAIDGIAQIEDILEIESSSEEITENVTFNSTDSKALSGYEGRVCSQATYSAYSQSDPVFFNEGDKITVVTKNAAATIAVVAYQEGPENNPFYRSLVAGNASEQTATFIVPFSTYFVFSYVKAQGITVTREYTRNETDSERIKALENSIGQVDALAGQVTELGGEVADVEGKATPVLEDDMTTGYVEDYFINHGGDLSGNSSFGYKEFTVRAGAVISITIVEHPNIAAIAKKLREGKYVELVPATSDGGAVTHTYTATEDMTIAVSFYQTYDRSITISTDYINSNRLNIVALQVALQQKDASDEVRDIDLGFFFDKIAVIGDSMAVATMDGYSPTTGSAWLSFLAKRWNCTGKQFYAFGGTGAYDWLNNSSWGLGKMLADETVYNAYFIAYGHNDSASVGEATDAAAPVTITGGVPSCPSGYSFCAYLKAVVAQIREKAPHAMIFMLSQYDYSVAPGGWHSQYGEAVIAVAEALYAGGDKLVHHLDTGGVPDADMELGSHYSTVGYAYIAKRVNDEVNKVMYQYRADTEIKTFGVYNL